MSHLFQSFEVVGDSLASFYGVRDSEVSLLRCFIPATFVAQRYLESKYVLLSFSCFRRDYQFGVIRSTNNHKTSSEGKKGIFSGTKLFLEQLCRKRKYSTFRKLRQSREASEIENATRVKQKFFSDLFLRVKGKAGKLGATYCKLSLGRLLPFFRSLDCVKSF